MNKVPHLLCALLILLAAAPVLSADENDKLFPVFLTGLVKRHDELKTAAMPGVEVHAVPGTEEAVYMLNFNKPEDVQTFIDALKAENIPYGTRQNYELQVILFSSDMIQFIWIDVLGL
ncbi:MAG: hypothetical protein FWC22_04805 [Treponema sp.]|nr:hypothetical protein [Treponema sp.]